MNKNLQAAVLGIMCGVILFFALAGALFIGLMPHWRLVW